MEWIKLYWNVLFSQEYFPMFEFYTLAILVYFVSISFRLNSIQNTTEKMREELITFITENE